jgi:DNA-binding transcriptional ArsR family regulator
MEPINKVIRRIPAAGSGGAAPMTSPRKPAIFNHVVEYSPAALNLGFGALADPTRRAILTRLAKEPATVTEIARPFGVPLNAISKHLMVPEKARLIRRERLGRERHCSPDAATLREAAAWIEQHRQLMTAAGLSSRLQLRRRIEKTS